MISSLFIMKEVNISCLMDLWSLLPLSVVPIIAIHLSCLLQVGCGLYPYSFLLRSHSVLQIMHKYRCLDFVFLKMLFFFFYNFYLFFWLCWVFAVACRLCLVAVSRGYSSFSAQASHCGGFSCGVWSLVRRLSSCGAQAQLPCSMWYLPGPGISPVSSALAARFLTTGQPGKSSMFDFESLSEVLIRSKGA